MAWQEPKTDWSAADHVTYSDMNRIRTVFLLSGKQKSRESFSRPEPIV